MKLQPKYPPGTVATFIASMFLELDFTREDLAEDDNDCPHTGNIVAQILKELDDEYERD